MIKTIIFDFDGLLVNSEPIYISCTKDFLRERGVTDFSIMGKLFGLKCEDATLAMKNEFNLEGSLEELADIRAGYIMKAFDDGKLELMPYVIETLEALKDEYKLAIGSSSRRDLLQKGLEVHNLEKYFLTIVCGDDVQNGKPNPDIHLKVAKILNEDPANCVVLDDAPNGILAANNAGMMSVAVPHEHTINLEFPHPDYIINSLEEFPSLIKKH